MVVADGKIVLAYLNYYYVFCFKKAPEQIEVGDNNLFGPNVVVVDHDHNYRDTDMLICKQGFQKEAVRIGSICWICANVVITRGAQIEDGIVVAANFVVKGKLQQPGLYAGSPAKLVRREDK